ncbi:hypothetical protein [Paenibacillus sp. FJAT-26967]|uniref:hypothetical protein n=1 Tax=Paenibacillus sp. FJAT-26967 TaxID=1729690 RepID=UPI0008382B8E|nr:hypothetical protein [Paenibacillus sp. FJAT-26967]
MFNRNKLGVWLGMAVVLLLVSAGCAKEQTDEEKLAEAIKNSLANSVNKAADPAAKKEEPTVESKLSEISNFVTSSIWNEGFVNIGWYKNSGTGSTGEKIDIDFTIDRLGKAMEKKAEYNTYIQGLDAKYDNVKQVWAKLSNEADILYKQLKESKPQANDKSYKFDTGLFKQYSEAFKDDVRALKTK